MTESVELVLDPSNPFDFAEGELEELAAQLGAVSPGAKVLVHRREEEGYGGPLAEVLIIWMGAGGAAGSTLAIWNLADKVGKVLQERWRREAEDCGPEEKPRARKASFVDVDGKPLLSVEIDLPDGEVVGVEEVEPMSRPYPGPPLREV